MVGLLSSLFSLARNRWRRWLRVWAQCAVTFGLVLVLVVVALALFPQVETWGYFPSSLQDTLAVGRVVPQHNQAKILV